MGEKLCPECSFMILGRTNKVFCSDKCRNTYNNKLKKKTRVVVNEINNILLKNRRILENFYNEGSFNINRQQLIKRGFHFEYFTHISINKSNKQIYLCDEYAYVLLDHEMLDLHLSTERFK